MRHDEHEITFEENAVHIASLDSVIPPSSSSTLKYIFPPRILAVDRLQRTFETLLYNSTNDIIPSSDHLDEKRYKLPFIQLIIEMYTNEYLNSLSPCTIVLLTEAHGR